MKEKINFFAGEAPTISDSKTYILMVTSYDREAYLTVSLLLRCDQSIYGKLVEDMGHSYALGQDNYPRTLHKIQNLLANFKNSSQMTSRPPTGGIAFSQEQTNDEGNGPTNSGHGEIQIRK